MHLLSLFSSMLSDPLHSPLSLVIGLPLLVGLLGYLKYRSLAGRIKNVTTCGYIAPAPTAAAVKSLNRVARFFTFLQVGKIRYVGLENLQNCPGPNVYSANHPHWIDPLIASLVVNKPARYMAHGRVLQSLGGLFGLYLSKRGVFIAQDSIKDGGVRTREAAVQFLSTDQQVVIFPEGYTNFSPSIDSLRAGTVKIVREAAIRLGKPVYIVPGYTRYGKYPGAWLAKFDRAVQFFMVFLAFPVYRRGAVVTVGKPISSHELYGPTLTERTDDQAVALLKQRIESLDPGHI